MLIECRGLSSSLTAPTLANGLPIGLRPGWGVRFSPGLAVGLCFTTVGRVHGRFGEIKSDGEFGHGVGSSVPEFDQESALVLA